MLSWRALCSDHVDERFDALRFAFEFEQGLEDDDAGGVALGGDEKFFLTGDVGAVS